MTEITRPVPPDPWIDQLFSSKAALKGSVVRRSQAWVHREVGRDVFEAEIKRRGFHLIETGGQFIIICNSGAIRMIC